MASTKTSRQKKAFIFFNCDEEKSETSMNLFYNKQIYNDTKKARTQLLEKLKSEQDAGKIQIDDLAAVEQLVMSGDPTQASQHLTFGAIVAFPIV